MLTLLIPVAVHASTPLSLPEAVALAQKASPVLRAARADLAVALAAEKGAWAMTGPQASANGFLTTGNNAANYASPPLSEPGVVMAAPPGRFLDGNLMVMVPLLAQQLQSMAASFRWQSKAAAGEFKEAQSDVTLRVTEAYNQVLFMQAEVAVSEAKLASTRELLKTTEALFESGAGIQASVQRVRAEMSRSERDLVTARNNEAKARLNLNEAMGVPLESEFTLASFHDVPKEASALAEWLKRAQIERGVLIASRARTLASGSELRAARDQALPKLYATGMADATNRRDMGGLSVGLSLSFPLFDGGRVRSEVAKAKAMKEKADANLAEVELSVSREVRQAFLDFETARSNMSSVETELTAVEAAYNVIAIRVAAGKGILLEQLDSLQTLTRSRADHAQARLDLQLSMARLRRAAGGVQ